MNLNTLSTILTNFIIKFKDYPSPTMVRNMDLTFVIEENGILDVKHYTVKGVQLNKEGHRVEVLLIEHLP